MKATHVLETVEGVELARIKLYKGGRTDAIMHGEKVTSYSPSLNNALAMGHWECELYYLFGPRVDAIPRSAKIRKLEQ